MIMIRIRYLTGQLIPSLDLSASSWERLAVNSWTGDVNVDRFIGVLFEIWNHFEIFIRSTLDRHRFLESWERFKYAENDFPLWYLCFKRFCRAIIIRVRGTTTFPMQRLAWRTYTWKSSSNSSMAHWKGLVGDYRPIDFHSKHFSFFGKWSKNCMT